ncbi:hypothetical protein N7539_003420 [Penicillium diatomitis]|uniref:F-box domain-containing protein n=1 Tax=Penicillium diatomitis TaxID=2819901 RepID=A0A9X0BX93_9EURO|nr:uncharacterized protein N7539_003420 [Penicillium diatomitis]KAJ5488530.1 hypothetical protein N7539_003420 [Penicillium diatomitis]
MVRNLNLHDPLAILPPEIILRILDFSPVSTLGSLLAVSKAWHQFIDVTHQDAIYSAGSKTAQPENASRDLKFLNQSSSVTNYYRGTSSWKELCKRQTLLAHNWAAKRPVHQESVLQVGNDSVWRFRADFKRRLILSTAHEGGFNVTDMDSGQMIWRLPSTYDRDEDAVRPYAHLEYEDGVAVFDREGNAVEVWKTDLEGAARGEFRRIAVLDHEVQTRGFQLSYRTLCVVSNAGKGFVYDMTQQPPRLTTCIDIEHGAVGHLDQSEDSVIYSMGTKGYYAYHKKSGAFLGILRPTNGSERFHICAPHVVADAETGHSNQAQRPNRPRREVITPVQVTKGALPLSDDTVALDDDEWGAGMLDGELFVGFSRAGRVFVCPNWRSSLRDQSASASACHGSVIECASNGSNFDLGGWLAVRHHRILFEIQDRIYVVSLGHDNHVRDASRAENASFSIWTSSAPQLVVPVSYMTLCEDAILTTFTTIGWRRPLANIPGDHHGRRDENTSRIFPTKAIRILSMAPDIFNASRKRPGGSIDRPNTEKFRARAGPGQPTEQMAQSQADLFQLVSLLEDDPEDWEDQDSGSDLEGAE